MPSPALSYFLNSRRDVALLETIEISHSAFSQTYRLVRNHTEGVTVTLENATPATFDYYPLRLTELSDQADLDTGIRIDFGDLGEVLPRELDNVLGKNIERLEQSVANVYDLSTPGVITNTSSDVSQLDNFGTAYKVKGPMRIVFRMPVVLNNTTQIGFSLDGQLYTGSTLTWATILCGLRIFTDRSVQLRTLSSAIPILPAMSAMAGDVYELAYDGASTVEVYRNGENIYTYTSMPLTAQDGLFVKGYVRAGHTLTGVIIESLGAAEEKPQIIYRAYRSDDLSAPLIGPLHLEATAFSFTREGASFEATAPYVNRNRTGQTYNLTRFYMLRGFLK